jgi:hypothetical protein
VPQYRHPTTPPPGTDTSIIRIAAIQPVGCSTMFGGCHSRQAEAAC